MHCSIRLNLIVLTEVYIIIRSSNFESCWILDTGCRDGGELHADKAMSLSMATAICMLTSDVSDDTFVENSCEDHIKA